MQTRQKLKLKKNVFLTSNELNFIYPFKNSDEWISLLVFYGKTKKESK